MSPPSSFLFFIVSSDEQLFSLAQNAQNARKVTEASVNLSCNVHVTDIRLHRMKSYVLFALLSEVTLTLEKSDAVTLMLVRIQYGR